MGLGAPELLIIGVLGLLAIIPIVALVDAARRPADAWQRSGQNQTLWIVLNAVGIALCGVGVIVGTIYLTVIRPQVKAASAPVPPPAT